MPEMISAPPATAVEPVTDMLHGVPITDPYRWLENQNSLRTRAWIDEQTRYARSYLDNTPGRERIRERIRELLAVETCDSFLKAGNRYFFRKRLADQEQPSIYMRDGVDGEDQMLVDPSEMAEGTHTAVKPLRLSADGCLLLYEIKRGGERTGTFAILDVASQRNLPDVLPKGYLRGFAFSTDNQSFYYVHEALESQGSCHQTVRRHFLGTDFSADQVIFSVGEGARRLALISDSERLGFLVHEFETATRTSFYLKSLNPAQVLECVLASADYLFGPLLANDRIFAITNREAPNLRIVELRPHEDGSYEWFNLAPERDARIHRWLVLRDRIFVSYVSDSHTQILSFGLDGKEVTEFAASDSQTIRLVGVSADKSEAFLETESFTQPITISRYSLNTRERTTWTNAASPFAENFTHARVWFRSSDGTPIPMYLVGRRDVLYGGTHAAIMTAYGGYGISMTPQFSVFAAFMMERGCLFALPNIRGGSEFGAAWHAAAKRRNRQAAFDDFLCAADWLVRTGRTTPDKLAIFGGSNSGLLVGAAITQRPELFRAAVCMVPLMDMLRYHLFDGAHLWRDELGTSDDADDFAALLEYSPYHRVRDGVAYPATLIVSGGADQNCNPLHALKMTARLQAANQSRHPILLGYSKFRGHSPVLPLTERVDALTDRMAFLCDQLRLTV